MTAQACENLIIDGEETSMAFCPPVPFDDPRIVEVDEDDVKENDSFVFSTACWRGYIGTWEIKDGRFFLNGLRGRFKLTVDEPIFADWFTGVLRIPRGERLQYVHMGFGSVYEEELHIKIEEGRVITSRVIDNRGKKIDASSLSTQNLPGGENRFPGDDDL